MDRPNQQAVRGGWQMITFTNFFFENTMATIRNYQPGDEAAAYHVCMKTGDHGADGEPFFQDDPDALGRIYVGPYLKFAPEFALMLEDSQGVCGYALAAPDSREFFDRYEREWRADLARQFAAPVGQASNWSRLESVYDDYHHPDYFCPEPYGQYPSHLHIDLLERAQGQGYGKRMMQELIDRLRENGSPGVHLGLSSRNERAYGFYRALGFSELVRQGEVIYMGLRL